MTQEELWNKNFELLRLFICDNRQRPSKHRIEEHRMLNWYRHNKRLLLKEKMPLHRQVRFCELIQLAEHFQRLNQYAYKKNTNQQKQLEIW